MQPTTTKPFLAVAFEAVVIAILVATAMTFSACLASLPKVDNPNGLQIVLLLLNLPAYLVTFFMVFSGPEHAAALRKVFPVLVFMQWFVIGGGIGLVEAVWRRARKPNKKHDTGNA